MPQTITAAQHMRKGRQRVPTSINIRPGRCASHPNRNYEAYLSGSTVRTVPSEVPSVISSSGAWDNGIAADISSDPPSQQPKKLAFAADVVYPKGWAFGSVVMALALSVFLVSLDMTIVATAIPKISDDFGGISDIVWYGSAFFATVGAFQSTWGKIYKYFSLKLSFLVAITLFELGSLICGLAPHSTALITGRAIAGIGAAGIGSGAYVMIAHSVEPQKRPVFTGLLGTAYGLAAVVGPLIGGALADRVSWRWCFYLNLPIGLLATLIIMALYKTPAYAEPMKSSLKEKILQMDLVGTSLVMGGIIACVLALQYGGQAMSWTSKTVIGLLVGFTAICAVFGVWEYFNGSRSMIDARLMRLRDVWNGSVFSALFAGSYFIVVYYLPIYFQSVDGSSPTESGVRNLPLILSVTVSTITSGWLVSKTGIAAPIMLASAAFATASAGMLYTLSIGTSTIKWAGYQILGGTAWGTGFQLPLIMAQGRAGPEDISSVTSIILFFQTVGGAFWLSAAQSAFVNALVARLAVYAPDVDPLVVLSTGATQIRHTFPAEQVPGILASYMAGIKTAFAIAIGAVGLSFAIGLFCNYKRLETDQTKTVGMVRGDENQA